MFLSTIVPSTMLDIRHNLNTSPYKFSIPYNFTRGRNLILNINPQQLSVSASNTINALNNAPYYSNPININRVNVLIPDDVIVYNITMTVYHAVVYGPQTYGDVIYNISIEFDTAQGIITFAPVSTTGYINETWANNRTTSAVLITVSTIL